MTLTFQELCTSTTAPVPVPSTPSRHSLLVSPTTTTAPDHLRPPRTSSLTPRSTPTFHRRASNPVFSSESVIIDSMDTSSLNTQSMVFLPADYPHRNLQQQPEHIYQSLSNSMMALTTSGGVNAVSSVNSSVDSIADQVSAHVPVSAHFDGVVDDDDEADVASITLDYSSSAITPTNESMFPTFAAASINGDDDDFTKEMTRNGSMVGEVVMDVEGIYALPLTTSTARRPASCFFSSTPATPTRSSRLSLNNSNGNNAHAATSLASLSNQSSPLRQRILTSNNNNNNNNNSNSHHHPYETILPSPHVFLPTSHANQRMMNGMSRKEPSSFSRLPRVFFLTLSFVFSCTLIHLCTPEYSSWDNLTR